MLCLKRDEAMEKLVEEEEKKSRVEAARSQHAASMVFVAQLLDPAQLEAAKQHLLEANKVVWVSESSSRTLVAVDGTLSSPCRPCSRSSSSCSARSSNSPVTYLRRADGVRVASRCSWSSLATTAAGQSSSCSTPRGLQTLLT